MSQSSISSNLSDSLDEALAQLGKIEDAVDAQDKATPDNKQYVFDADTLWGIMTDMGDALKGINDALDDIRGVVR
jgi:hypothetical protein